MNKDYFKGLKWYIYLTKRFTNCNESKYLIIRFRDDKNKDGRYDDYREPLLLKKYNFETGVFTDIVPPQLHNELQRTLEGSDKIILILSS